MFFRVALLFVFWVCAGARNPIVSNVGMADPHARAFGDSVYIYATHDYSNLNTDYRMDDWWIWKTTDLLSYEKVSVLNPSVSMKWTNVSTRHSCWATDAGEKAGNYFWYLSVGPTSVAVLKSERDPAGPWNDVLKRPLLSAELGDELKTQIRDPSILAYRGKRYIIFGTFTYYIAELGEDMMSLAEHPRLVQVRNALGNYGPGKTDDKPFLHVHDGSFYLSYGSFYSISESGPYGPYNFVGSFVATEAISPRFRSKPSAYNKSAPWWKNPDTQNRHGSFLHLHNQWYWFGCDISHSTDLKHPSYFRDVVAGYVHYFKNGSIAPVKIDEVGVGSYDARSRIEAENFFKASGVLKEESSVSSQGFHVKVDKNDSYLFYPNIMVPSKKPTIRFLGNFNSGSVRVEVNSQYACTVRAGLAAKVCKLPQYGNILNVRLQFSGNEEGIASFALDYFVLE
jgi:arabinoxylan arabinofuranohydrolase